MADFIWSSTDEPHASRRRAILAAHPNVTTLFGVDAELKYKVLGVVLLQVTCAYVAAGFDTWMPWLGWTYVFGGTLNHTLTLAMHELSHNLASRSLSVNRALGFVANLPLGIPSFASFKKYHMDHHKYQGEDGIDADVPSALEVCLVGHGFFTKLLWVLLQPLAYSLRPLLSVRKPFSWLEVANVALVLGWDACIGWFWGAKALLYMVCGTLLGMGLHPMAGHFIAEHYAFNASQETYSYYGLLNALSFNVGYHNEHHDFPNIPGCRLPQLKAMAPEFYDTLDTHSSWVGVIWRYLTDPTIGPNTRIKRARLTLSEKSEILARSATL